MHICMYTKGICTYVELCMLYMRHSCVCVCTYMYVYQYICRAFTYLLMYADIC